MNKASNRAHSTAARQALRAACCLWAFWVANLAAAAQATPAAQPTPAVRLVSIQQGRTIVDAALQPDQPALGAQDCSHLVHDIYSLAGYEYPYASSFELYAGHGSFRRVRHPQAGDLIAWRGHVGIVLEPRQHTFYSLVRSGLQAEDYQGLYWRSRGTPRFYRYVLEVGAQVETAEAKHASPPRSAAATRSNHSTVALDRDQPDTSANAPAVQETSERTPVLASRPAANKSEEEPVPSSILISGEQRKPTADEIADGISELSNAAANLLRRDEPLRVQTPLVIFDDLRVERVEIKRDKGWAHLQIESHVRIAGDGADFKRQHEKVRWELRRGENGWMAIAPAERKYVSRDVAVRILAAQLAQMAQSDGAARHDDAVIGQEARIANLLSALLEK